MKKDSLLLQTLIGVFLCVAVGLIGSFFTISEVSSWYTTISTPFWQPPSWLFGPVWTALYILMGIAGARIWTTTKAGDVRRQLFGAQLLLNFLWTPVFFGAHNILGGLVLILALDFTVLALLWRVRQDTSTAWFLAPYFVWILFATALNTAILSLNL